MATGNEEGWVTVSEEEDAGNETKIIFDTLGDSFTGTYLGMRTVEPSDGTRPYQQARFENEGTVYFTNAGFNLRKGLTNVKVNSLVRVTYVNEIDSGQAQPMKVFRVEVAKRTMHATPTAKPTSKASEK